MARTFNGTSDGIRADAAHVAVVNSAFSVAFWVNAATQSASRYMYGEGRSTTSTPAFGIQTNASSTRPNVFLKDDGNNTKVNVTLTATALNSTWHHICYSQDASNNYVIYVDGSSDHTGSYTSTGLTIDRLTFGALTRTSTASFFAGILAEIANWSRQLSSQEVASLANGMLASHLAPSHYWPIWGIDSPEPDIVGGGTNGTVTGTSLSSGPPVQRAIIYIPNYLHTSIQVGHTDASVIQTTTTPSAAEPSSFLESNTITSATSVSGVESQQPTTLVDSNTLATVTTPITIQEHQSITYIEDILTVTANYSTLVVGDVITFTVDETSVVVTTTVTNIIATKTTLSGGITSGGIISSVNITTVDYYNNPWTTSYTTNPGVTVVGSIGDFDTDTGLLPVV